MNGAAVVGAAIICLYVAGLVRLGFIVRRELRKRGAQSGRLRRLAWRRKLPKRLSQREQREWMRLCWVLEHVDSYDPDAVAADDTEGAE